MTGAYVAATVVALVQYLRLKDRRLLLLLAMFAFQAQALARDWFDVWKDVCQAGACASALALLVILTYRPHSHPTLDARAVKGDVASEDATQTEPAAMTQPTTPPTTPPPAA